MQAQAQSLLPPPDPAPAPSALEPALPHATVTVDIEHAEPTRTQELMRLAAQRERLLAGNRRWQVPGVGLMLGIASLGAGVNQYFSAEVLVSSDCIECKSHDDEADRRFLAGAALMAIGSALTLLATPMLIVRASRASRLLSLEREITRLGGKLTLAPALAARAEAGLRARFAF